MQILRFALTIFLSAFLLFQIQPMVAKIILPWFGGVASVWTVCMLFFQVALLGGYFYSHMTIRRGISPRVHAALLALSLFVLPVGPSDAWKPAGSEDSTFLILKLLLVTVGLPYFLLSTTGPLIQAWYAREHPEGMPYRLYALSNVGSMLALLSYPVLIEPFLPVKTQAAAWSAAYAVFVALCSWTALNAKAVGRREDEVPGAGEPAAPGLREKLLWVALAACASMMLLAVTNHLTQDVAPVPMLWILPLTLYLLTFILCFDAAGWYRRSEFLLLAVISSIGMLYLLGAGSEDIDMKAGYLIAIFSAGMFFICMCCHGELASRKPHPRYLTSFFLMISIGGAIGGLFVGLAAPYLFAGYFELSIAIIGSMALLLASHRSDKTSSYHEFLQGWKGAVAFGLVAVMAISHARSVYKINSSYRVMKRGFFGTLATLDYGKPGDEDYARGLQHGAINHGEQYMDEDRRREPTTYFGPKTGIARAIEAAHRDRPQRVGVLGLGAGVMFAYARKGDDWTLYEINSQVIDIARQEFTFIKDCPAKVEFVLGDGRLALEREAAREYDVLFIDAFSGDSPPVHLLTREAFELYFRHLKPDGALVMHISNRYVDLGPVVARGAEALGKKGWMVHSQDDDPPGFYGSSMAVLSAIDLPGFEYLTAPLKTKASVPAWTDGYSNLLRILK